jgi:ferredoxin
MSLDLPQHTPHGLARAMAFRSVQGLHAEPTSMVAYRSHGALLIIGAAGQALACAARLKGGLSCTVLAPPQPGPFEPPGDVTVLWGAPESVSGYLGRYQVAVMTERGPVDLARAVRPQGGAFDLVLDLCTPAHIAHELKPPGYYAPMGDEQALEDALAELPEMVGEFEKPRFFVYNPSIWAHSASGLSGCNNCLEACPTGAITPAGDKIEVNPYLCQGAGSCAAACPTGAIGYAYPRAGDLLESLKRILRAYRQYEGEIPVLLFHDAEAGAQAVAQIADRMPERVLPIRIEEAGSVGMDVWLAAIAYGASAVVVLVTATTPDSVRRTLEAQLEYARAILAGLGHGSERLVLHQADAVLAEALHTLPILPELPAATFAVMGDKRDTLRLAIDHLHDHAPQPLERVSLPGGAPFGQIRVDREACTLCMACVTVCPASALVDGKDTPRLSFIEWNCVQCGLCESACPERAISLEARLVFDREARMRARVLNEEQPFCCIVCGKPFVTQSLMSRMQDKLKDHWMYQNDQARRRMQMCGDCRVKDIYTSEIIVRRQ